MIKGYLYPVTIILRYSFIELSWGNSIKLSRITLNKHITRLTLKKLYDSVLWSEIAWQVYEFASSYVVDDYKLLSPVRQINIPSPNGITDITTIQDREPLFAPGQPGPHFFLPHRYAVPSVRRVAPTMYNTIREAGGTTRYKFLQHIDIHQFTSAIQD